MNTIARKRTAKRRTPAKPARAQTDATAADRVTITHPEREVFPGTGISKGDVAVYYRSVAEWLVPEIQGRPLSVLRCPGGVSQQCFFQKHPGAGWGAHVGSVPIMEKTGTKKYLCLDGAAGLMELVQMNVIEFHPWGTRAKNLQHVDRIVFDLDPHPTVAWPRVRAAARDLRLHLEGVGLQSFLRTSGGKAFHIVVPLRPGAAWDKARLFAQATAETLARTKPRDYVAVAGDKHRVGKIFIDWLRNGHGATSVASYSLRARASAGVAMPLAWEQLTRIKSGDAFTLRNTLAYLRKRDANPWQSIDTIKQSLPKR